MRQTSRGVGPGLPGPAVTEPAPPEKGGLLVQCTTRRLVGELETGGDERAAAIETPAQVVVLAGLVAL